MITTQDENFKNEDVDIEIKKARLKARPLYVLATGWFQCYDWGCRRLEDSKEEICPPEVTHLQ